MMFPAESLRTNVVKKRNASWFAKKFAMTNARRSGSIDSFGLAREQRFFTVGLVKVRGELLPERGIRRLRQLEDLAAGDAFREKPELVRPRKLRRVLAFHEARERFAEQGWSLSRRRTSPPMKWRRLL